MKIKGTSDNNKNSSVHISLEQYLSLTIYWEYAGEEIVIKS